MGMSIPYELTGRRQQKARTRDALIGATRELMAQGRTPTVEEAASAASISRTTAYRYFPNQRALLLAAHPEIDAVSLLSDGAPEDGQERFELVVEAFTRLVVETEAQQRTTLRLSLEPAAGDREPLLLRQGRAIAWLEDALVPLRDELPEAAIRRLVLATRAACGIEALVWLTDVAGLSREDAVEVMRWSARALFRTTTQNGSGPPRA
jgi:AcrR family transcriptional regulator